MFSRAVKQACTGIPMTDEVDANPGAQAELANASRNPPCCISCRCRLLHGQTQQRRIRRRWMQCSCPCSAWDWSTWTLCSCMQQEGQTAALMHGGLWRQLRRRCGSTRDEMTNKVHCKLRKQHNTRVCAACNPRHLLTYSIQCAPSQQAVTACFLCGWTTSRWQPLLHARVCPCWESQHTCRWGLLACPRASMATCLNRIVCVSTKRLCVYHMHLSVPCFICICMCVYVCAGLGSFHWYLQHGSA